MTNYNRTPDRQRLMAYEAERLLAEHARKLQAQRGTPLYRPTAATTQVDPQQQQQDAAVGTLLQRLAVRDRGLT